MKRIAYHRTYSRICLSWQLSKTTPSAIASTLPFGWELRSHVCEGFLEDNNLSYYSWNVEKIIVAFENLLPHLHRQLLETHNHETPGALAGQTR